MPKLENAGSCGLTARPSSPLRLDEPDGSTNCPLCLSTTCRSNRISNLRFEEIAGNVWSATRSGRAAQGLRDLTGWVCVEAANALRNRWSCDYCGHGFR